MNMDTEDDQQLAPVPAASSTMSITSMLTVRQVRAKVFAQFNLYEQRSLRLVCKDWNNAIGMVMRNMKSVTIGIIGPEIIWRGLDYRIGEDKQALLTLLERHANVRELAIIPDYINDLWHVDEDITSRIGSLGRLEHLRLVRLEFTSNSYEMLATLPRLISLTLDQCQLAEADFSGLSESIRRIHIESCFGCERLNLLEAMRTLHARGIALEELVFSCCRAPFDSLRLAGFMLENFASRRVLKLENSRGNYGPTKLQPLRRFVAVNIERLHLSGANLPESYHRQLFASLLAQPLPHLRDLHYYYVFLFDDDIVNRFWTMCPELDRMSVMRECEHTQFNMRLSYVYRPIELGTS